ncbi:MAG: DUF971 domain-containing protein [Acidimicrobiia bacterium]|nr:DUF971 domain-containing protein [Acidimicrobiia bacterium]
MDERHQPESIDVAKDAAVTVTYLDGYVARFDLVSLRQGCPCATCRNFRERGEDSWPRPNSPVPLRVERAQLHGAWGLNITWNDGHATGIYPFDLLRRWHEAPG